MTEWMHSIGLLPDLTRICHRYPLLRRWYLGNRLRRLTIHGEYHFSRAGASALPRSISFRPTFLCNARCKMCSYANSTDPVTLQSVTSDPRMIDLDVACRMVDAIAPAHTMIHITGGEPLVWGEQLFAFLRYCRRRKVPTSVTTNGILLERYLDQLQVDPPDTLVFSLLGPEETHNDLVGLQVQAKIRAALHALLAAKGGDRLRAPLLVTNTAMLPENVAVLASVPKIAHALGAVLSNFQPLWITTEAMQQEHKECLVQYDERYTACQPVNPTTMSPQRIRQAMEEIRSEGARLGLHINFYPRLHRDDIDTYYQRPDVPIGRTRALCAHLVAQVLPDGSVSPCLGHTVGNLYTDPFDRIWNGAEMQEFRRQLRTAKLFPICARCCLLWRNE